MLGFLFAKDDSPSTPRRTSPLRGKSTPGGSASTVANTPRWADEDPLCQDCFWPFPGADVTLPDFPLLSNDHSAPMAEQKKPLAVNEDDEVLGSREAKKAVHITCTEVHAAHHDVCESEEMAEPCSRRNFGHFDAHSHSPHAPGMQSQFTMPCYPQPVLSTSTTSWEAQAGDGHPCPLVASGADLDDLYNDDDISSCDHRGSTASGVGRTLLLQGDADIQRERAARKESLTSTFKEGGTHITEVQWYVPLDRFCGRGQRVVSGSIEVQFERRVEEFIIQLEAKEVNTRKKGKEFELAQGKGPVCLKCKSLLDDRAVEVRWHLKVGEPGNQQEASEQRHNFCDRPMSYIQLQDGGDDWNFRGGQNAMKLVPIFATIEAITPAQHRSSAL